MALRPFHGRKGSYGLLSGGVAADRSSTTGYWLASLRDVGFGVKRRWRSAKVLGATGSASVFVMPQACSREYVLTLQCRAVANKLLQTLSFARSELGLDRSTGFASGIFAEGLRSSRCVSGSNDLGVTTRWGELSGVLKDFDCASEALAKPVAPDVIDREQIQIFPTRSENSLQNL